MQGRVPGVLAALVLAITGACFPLLATAQSYANPTFIGMTADCDGTVRLTFVPETVIGHPNYDRVNVGVLGLPGSLSLGTDSIALTPGQGEVVFTLNSATWADYETVRIVGKLRENHLAVVELHCAPPPPPLITSFTCEGTNVTVVAEVAEPAALSNDVVFRLSMRDTETHISASQPFTGQGSYGVTFDARDFTTLTSGDYMAIVLAGDAYDQAIVSGCPTVDGRLNGNDEIVQQIIEVLIQILTDILK